MRRAALALLSLLACSRDAPPAEVWRPGVVLGSPAGPGARGLLDRRGLVHAHSVWSHDACDNEPEKDGVRDAACLADFRRGLCQSRHDFVMLTDHADAFARITFEEALLVDRAAGDRPVERGGQPVASWMACPDGHRPLITAGTESGFMPVGLEQHAAPEEGREGRYREKAPEVVELFREAGGTVLVSHTEDWTPETLIELGLDGFEMYNLHANALRSAGTVLELVVLASDRPAELPYPDLIFVPLWTEDPRYLETWGTVLARGRRVVTTMGTDCHQNSFPGLLPDGERGDSFRRMMGWFSNHLLVRPDADGRWDDRQLQEALAEGRLYGVFEALGFAEGFDAHARTADGAVVEIGGEVALSARPELVATLPRLRGLDPSRPAPELTVRWLRAIEGGFEEVAAGPSTQRFSPTAPGAYRAEVRMRPRHLAADLGKFAAEHAGRDLVWIYANAIQVR